MRSRSHYSVGSQEVHGWAQDRLVQAKLLKDHGWRCTALSVINILLRSASRCTSLSATCRDLSEGPSSQAVMTALNASIPKTWPVLERRIHDALTCELPRRMRRRRWQVAIDWHLTPYYGQPHRSRNELFYGAPRQGTTKFHAYATACIVDCGQRYTVALTYVRRHESKVVVLGRLVEQIRRISLKIKCVFLDRDFFNISVMQFLQTEQLPFLMPVQIRGQKPRRGRKATGLRWIKQQSAGWYSHTLKNRKGEDVTVQICVGYRRHKNRKDGKQRRQKLLFAAWRTRGTPTEIRDRYRKRFGIETSYRQMRQARIYTCTRNPRIRFFFVAVACILRNLWVWIHATRLAQGDENHLKLQLERLRFKQMTDWIALEIVAPSHDQLTPYAKCQT